MKKTRLGIAFIIILFFSLRLSATIYISPPSGTFSYDAGTNLHVGWAIDPAGNPPASTRLSVWLRTDTALVQIGRDIPAGNMSLDWMIPRTLFGEKMQVSIFREGTTELLSTSAGHFFIIPPTRIQVLSPNGGETFRPGSTILVRWRATDIVTEHRQFANIALYYYPSGCRIGGPVLINSSIAPNMPGIASGETGCRLTIPATAPLSSSYFIEINVQSTEYAKRSFNRGRFDSSDGCFAVVR
jgi:hypothetical protein